MITSFRALQRCLKIYWSFYRELEAEKARADKAEEEVRALKEHQRARSRKKRADKAEEEVRALKQHQNKPVSVSFLSFSYCRMQ